MEQPKHSVIADFRKRYVETIPGWMAQIVLFSVDLGMVGFRLGAPSTVRKLRQMPPTAHRRDLYNCQFESRERGSMRRIREENTSSTCPFP